MKTFKIGTRIISSGVAPFIIADAGINHDGDFNKAIQLVDAAKEAGADCIKFQCHITEAELIYTDIKPGYISEESLWDITKRIELTEDEDRRIKRYCEEKGIIYLSTPFSKEAADRLESMNVGAFKIGSGECNNLPLLGHIAKIGKPMILSTGMNDIESIKKSVAVIQSHNCPLMLMHCTSIYPTAYDKVRLGAITELQEVFGLPVGLSDHSMGIYTSLGAVALGVCVLEKHFTISRNWPGPDVPISIEPDELVELIKGSRAIFSALGGHKTVLPEEQPVMEFAFASVVSTKDIKKGSILNVDNIWVKKPGTGEISAEKLNSIIGNTAREDIKKGQQLTWMMIND
ncbi:MAG: polyhydroxyalkanoate biosynthesis repressor PhaR [Planctomycetes bacterium]|nr:polyhydroxyalkanoate biosynthesis repressor PhaR [Planctomycetota bacterium]